MSESETIEALAQHLLGRGLAVLAKEEARRIHNIRMTPAVGDDSRDVPPGVEAMIAEHSGELRAYRGLDLRIAHVEQFHAGQRALLGIRNPRQRKSVVHRE